MKRKIYNYILVILFILLLIFFITKPNIIILSINEATMVFFNNIFPTLFPFFIFSSFIVNYNVLTYFEIIYRPILKKLFHFNDNLSTIFILSMITGLPSNAKYIKELLDNNSISINDAEVFLSYSFFPNPMFVIATVGFSLLENKNIGLLLLISIYLTNFILAFFERNKLSNEHNLVIRNSKLDFSTILKKSIMDSFDSLIIILGSISIFVVLRNFLDFVFSFNPIINTIINCILEMTSGINKVVNLDLSLKIKTLLISGALYFSGLSVISQSIGILGDYKIDFKYVLKYKFYGLLLNLLITYNLYIIFRM